MGYSKFSFPFSLNLFSDRFLNSKKPKAGDVAVFRLPSDDSINYIKRIIGLPGDKIQIKNDILYINDKAVKREFIGNFYDSKDKINPIKIFKETLSSKVEFSILEQYDNSDIWPLYILFQKINILLWGIIEIILKIADLQYKLVSYLMKI